MYYRVTLVVSNRTDVDPDDLYDDFYNLAVGKGKVVECENVEEADDFDDSEIDASSIVDED
jgi:hypothetical protein